MFTSKEITKAYHKLALKWHPDKRSHNTDQSYYTENFQNLFNIYSEKDTDDKKRVYNHNISDRSADDNHSWK